MSLLASIQDECVSNGAIVSRLLRLCLQLAAQLKHAPLKEWVLHELNGYPDGAGLPDDRKFRTRSRRFFTDRLIGQATLDIPINVLPKELREKFSEARLDQPISQCTAGCCATGGLISCAGLGWNSIPIQRRGAR